jgi:hypothetical protein
VLGHQLSHSSSWGEDLEPTWPRLWWFQHVPGFENSTQIKEVKIVELHSQHSFLVPCKSTLCRESSLVDGLIIYPKIGALIDCVEKN